ncbi:MAG TPA: PD-(D/E)XK nuclease family protein [Ktedonobacteraceae bacterium]|nr:PD-(D/E)XK nuclease family protein [Ktedonobacteraceae bacterium]
MLLIQKDNSIPVRWSPSALQRMTQCGYSFYQRYVIGHNPRQHAAAWFGGDIVHRMIQMAYHGLSLEESFDQVWMTSCAPIYEDLQAWLELDRDYRLAKGSKRSDSKEAVAWLTDHPIYSELRDHIDAYQRTVFAYMRWNERMTLADYYRRSALLTEIPPEKILLPHPWLVEGQWLTVDADPLDEGLLTAAPEEDTLEEEEEKGRTYGLLEGTIGGIPVRGVPDVVARREDGMMLVVDYKTSARPLTAAQLSLNMQLLVYCELLRQNGVLLDGQEVLIGHIYLTETTVTQVWTDTSQLARRLPLIARQFIHAESRRAMGDFVPVAGIPTSFQDPCPTCDMAHVCDAVLVPASTESGG